MFTERYGLGLYVQFGLIFVCKVQCLPLGQPTIRYTALHQLRQEFCQRNRWAFLDVSCSTFRLFSETDSVGADATQTQHTTGADATQHTRRADATQTQHTTGADATQTQHTRGADATQTQHTRCRCNTNTNTTHNTVPTELHITL